MCDPVTLALGAMAAGGGLQAVSAIRQGNQQAAMGEFQDRQAQADASAEEQAAAISAQKVRTMTQRRRSEATAALAASGVRLGAGGAPDQIEEAIVQEGEQDALTQLITGRYRANSLRGGGRLARLSGENAQREGYIGAAGSLLQTAGNIGVGAQKNINAGRKWYGGS